MYKLTYIQMCHSILRIIFMIPVFLGSSLADVQAFDMFGIDILSAPRNQITEAILQRGSQKLPPTHQLTDRYDANPIFAGARMLVVFTADEKLKNIVCRFDSGSLFTDVLKFEALKQSLTEGYGKPAITPSENRNIDYEEELLWMKDGIKIQLVSYKWYAAWRIHATHRLCYYIIQDVEETGEDNFKISKLQ